MACDFITEFEILCRGLPSEDFDIELRITRNTEDVELTRFGVSVSFEIKTIGYMTREAKLLGITRDAVRAAQHCHEQLKAGEEQQRRADSQAYRKTWTEPQ